jgi:hypothetical protein
MGGTYANIRICEPEQSLENVWHVMDVLEGSPAESAGLVPYGDWIIGWSGGVLSAEGDFYDVVEAVSQSLHSASDCQLSNHRASSISTSHYESTYTLMTSSACYLKYRQRPPDHHPLLPAPSARLS